MPAGTYVRSGINLHRWSQAAGEKDFGVCVGVGWSNCPPAHGCCCCPLASLPGRRWHAAFRHLHGSEAWRVPTTPSDVGNVPQGQRGTDHQVVPISRVQHVQAFWCNWGGGGGGTKGQEKETSQCFRDPVRVRLLGGGGGQDPPCCGWLMRSASCSRCIQPELRGRPSQRPLHQQGLVG